MENFPPNSRASRERDPVERVTSADAVRRKPSLGKQFSRTFINGDAKTAGEYMVFEVVVPAARDLLVEAVHAGFERLVYGAATRPRRGIVSPNPYGHVNYRGMSQRPDDRPPMPNQRTLSRQARARHDFDEIVLATRQDAEEVLERMFDILDRYESVSVADLYELTGFTPTHTDKTWGWTRLKGASVGRIRSGGYLLDLPDPEHLG